MTLDPQTIASLRVEPGAPADLAHRSTTSVPAGPGAGGVGVRQLAREDLAAFVDELARAQRRLWADGRRSLLVILQAMDAAGKDGTIRHVTTGVNPQGCMVTSFKVPSAAERAHDFLWRTSAALPARGMIGIFNRSYYEEVLVVRVHPELLGPAPGAPGERVWKERFEDISSFERHLGRSGTAVLKLFLHVSKDEQRRRFLQRIDDPAKSWKLTPADLAERRYWDEYQVAYEEALTATSTEWAPWYVVPADHKYTLRALVGGLMVDAVDRMELAPPDLTAAELKLLAAAKAELLAE